jgi:hypothetical protein
MTPHHPHGASLAIQEVNLNAFVNGEQHGIAGERYTLAHENRRDALDRDTLATTIIAHHETFIIAV